MTLHVLQSFVIIYRLNDKKVDIHRPLMGDRPVSVATGIWHTETNAKLLFKK